MKITGKFIWALLSPIIVASPLQVDVNVHLDTDERPMVTDIVKPTPVCQQAASTSTKALPTVELGYLVHQASPDKTKDQTYYAFENIPYAQQPIGELRFKAAKGYTHYDAVDKPPFNNGSKTVVCPQEQLGWFGDANKWAGQLFNPNVDIDPRYEKPILPTDYPALSTPIPNQSEECLVLDVFVPKRVFDNENEALKPVIVSFHGGGFVFGSKTVFGSPAGILKAAGEKGVAEDVIVVSVNYRLGAFGWLGGDEFQKQGGFDNAGLSDQKAALEWVGNFINVFGGSPYEVTALGESAGASSILHHLTAYGVDRSAKVPPKFQKAILQSPAFFPITSQMQMKKTYQAFLKAAGATNFEELQKKDTKDLIEANRKTTYYSPYGTFTYGPVVSGEYGRDSQTYVQYPPTLKLLIGDWFRGVQLMIAHNRREGALFTPPWLRDEASLEKYIRNIYPAMTNDSVQDFAKLYPVPQTKIVGTKKVDTTARERFTYAAAAFGDLGVDCNMYILKNRVPKDTSYRYFYRVYPGFHGQDVGATWYPEAGEGLNKLNPPEQSERLQRWLTCFAKETSNPNCNKDHDDKEFKAINTGEFDQSMWIGSAIPVLDKNNNSIDKAYEMSSLPGSLPSESICEFWNSAPYWEPDPELMRKLIIQNDWQTEL